MDLFTHLIVETIGSCNRTCSTCLRQSYPEELRDEKHEFRTVEHKIGDGYKMPTDTFVSILDQAKELGFGGIITLQYFNEPLLDDRFPDLVAIAREKFPRSPISFCTNGDLMTQEIASSIDGVVNSINIALYMPKDRMEKREGELRKMFSKTRLKFTRGAHNTTHFSPRTGRLVTLVNRCVEHPCTGYNHMLFINASGEVCHCCDDYSGHFDLGNVHAQTLEEIWNSDNYRKLVETLRDPGGRKEFDYCSKCPRRESVTSGWRGSRGGRRKKGRGQRRKPATAST